MRLHCPVQTGTATSETKKLGGERRRNRPKLKYGVVTSNSNDKTIGVELTWRQKHPKYGKILNRRTKLRAHDEKNEAKVGDLVALRESRPFSRTKHHSLVRIISSVITSTCDAKPDDSVDNCFSNSRSGGPSSIMRGKGEGNALRPAVRTPRQEALLSVEPADTSRRRSKPKYLVMGDKMALPVDGWQLTWCQHGDELKTWGFSDALGKSGVKDAPPPPSLLRSDHDIRLQISRSSERAAFLFIDSFRGSGQGRLISLVWPLRRKRPAAAARETAIGFLKFLRHTSARSRQQDDLLVSWLINRRDRRDYPRQGEISNRSTDLLVAALKSEEEGLSGLFLKAASYEFEAQIPKAAPDPADALAAAFVFPARDFSAGRRPSTIPRIVDAFSHSLRFGDDVADAEDLTSALNAAFDYLDLEPG
jgi:small subunit ribosomal protein S17